MPVPASAGSWPPRPPAHRVAVVVLLTLALAVGAAVAADAARTSWTAVSGPAPRVDDVVVLLAGAAGALLAAWWAAGTALVTLALVLQRRGTLGDALGRASRRAAPSLLRVAVAALLGAGTLAVPVLASAAPAPTVATSTVGTRVSGDSGASGLSGVSGVSGVSVSATTATRATGPDPTPTAGLAGTVGTVGTGRQDATEAAEVPDVAWRPSAPPRQLSPATEAGTTLVAPRPTRAGTSSQAPEEVVVRRGDTLWDLTAQRLPAGADDTDVALAWPLLYAANREVVGDDPGHLLPGQRLVVPAGLGR